jgi:hypothetical protein
MPLSDIKLYPTLNIGDKLQQSPDGKVGIVFYRSTLKLNINNLKINGY